MSQTLSREEIEEVIEQFEEWAGVSAFEEAGSAYEECAQELKNRLPEPTPAEEMTRNEQVLYALEQEGPGTWVTASTITSFVSINDEDWRYKTVEGAMNRLAKDGELATQDIEGKKHRALPEPRSPQPQTVEEGSKAHDHLERYSHLGMSRPSDGDSESVLVQLVEDGFMNRRQRVDGDERWYEYWLTDAGSSRLSSLQENDEWMGGL